MKMPKPVTNVVKPHVVTTHVSPPGGHHHPVEGEGHVPLDYPDTVKGRAAQRESERQDREN